MRNWSVSHSLADGWMLELREEKPWAYALHTVWDAACELTGGRLGGHGFKHEIWWKIPVGKPVYDRSDPDEPWLENSIAARLYDLENAVLNLSWRRGTIELTGRGRTVIKLTDEQAKLLAPDFYEMFKEDEE